MLLFSGIGAYKDITDQHVPGFPKPSQVRLYLYTPVALVGLNFVLFLIGPRVSRSIVVAVLLTQAVFFLGVLVVQQGGV